LIVKPSLRTCEINYLEHRNSQAVSIATVLAGGTRHALQFIAARHSLSMLEETLTMIPNTITASHVVRAIAEIDKDGVPTTRESKRYDLVHQGRRYPPKYVVSLAARYATGQPLAFPRFNGGAETNRFLESLGFDIKTRADGRTQKP
jgi:hypothetical protein